MFLAKVMWTVECLAFEIGLKQKQQQQPKKTNKFRPAEQHY